MLHGCILHDECFIGMGAIIMDGAVVETRVMLGGGALVPPGMRLESGFLYIGSPARKARALKPEEHDMIVKSAANYVRLAKEYQGKLKVGKLNIDENPQLPTQYEVRSIPTLLVFKDGRVVGQLVGAVPKPKIDELVKKSLS